MQHLILGLLLIAPMSLYDLHKQFLAGPALFYSASFGSIQRALRQLIERGLVTVTDAPDSPRRRKLHSPTPAGIAAWRAWMREPISGAGAETAMLAKVFLLGLLPAGREREDALATLRAAVAGAHDELRELARELDAAQVPAPFADVFRYQRATLDYGLRSHALAEEWLQTLSSGA